MAARMKRCAEPPSRRTRRGARRGWLSGSSRGVSLVEVIVVMVILVIGIFAITRLFPEGIASLGFSANNTLANALSRLNEEYHREFRENLPDAVVGVDPGPGPNAGRIRDDFTPRDLIGGRPYLDNPINGYSGTPPDDPRYSDVNIARRVLGEQFKVPPPVLGFGPAGETVSLYHALFAPLYSADRLGGASLGISAYSGSPYRRVVIGREPATEVEWRDLYAKLDPYSYAISYDTAKLYFLMTGAARMFRIEFTYRVQLQTPTDAYTTGDAGLDNCIYLPPGKDGDDPADPDGRIQSVDLHQPIPSADPECVFSRLPRAGDPNVKEDAQLDPESEFLYRRLDRIPIGTAFSAADPFQYKVYDTLFGLIGVNPAAATLVLPYQRGRGLTVKIDYDADDWHILRQDIDVPTELVDDSSGVRTHTLKLITGGIKQVGDFEDTVNFLGGGGGGVDTTFEYLGLVRNYPAGATSLARPGTPGIDLVVVDLETGYQLDNTSLGRRDPNDNGDVDYHAGVIHLRDDATFTPPGTLGGAPRTINTGGRRVRVYYRTRTDVAVATFKPQNRLHPSSGAAPLRTREYLQYPYGYVLFANPDGEKTMAVDYEWQDRSGAVHTEYGELHRTERPLGGRGADPGPPPGPGKYWFRLGHADADPLKDSDYDPSTGFGPCLPSGSPTFDPGADIDWGACRYNVVPGSIRILGVRGASFHTRVVWREGPRFRYRERSTLLTRAQSR